CSGQASCKTGCCEEAGRSQKASSAEASGSGQACNYSAGDQLGNATDACCYPDCNAGNPDAYQSVLIFAGHIKTPGLRRSGVFYGIYRTTQIQCGSGLARESGASVTHVLT
ncbi:hypothetical protein, partial [Pseudomonas gingeri]|uniref:hypothetical protein n=1 Tax=Pseudomonas gingeri TaxID=117681 RepID=UPI001C432087